MEKNENSHKFLRLYNWVLSLACIAGAVIIMLQATLTGILYLLVFLAMLMASYTIPALLLKQGESKILGNPIPIDKSNKHIYKLSIATNVAFLTLGFIISAFAIIKEQYPASFFGILFIVLSYFNIKALSAAMKELD